MKSMKISKVWIILMSILVNSFGCKAQLSLRQLCDSLVQKNYISNEDLYFKFKSSSKESILNLIQVIDVKKIGFVGFGDPKSSTLYIVNENYCGIRAAYMIERILANENEKQLFNLGVIVKIKENQPEMKSLSYKDMQIIQKIYRDWWKKNKLKTVLELENEWRDGHQPLTGSMYLWK